jgi:hypothetical protein
MPVRKLKSISSDTAFRDQYAPGPEPGAIYPRLTDLTEVALERMRGKLQVLGKVRGLRCVRQDCDYATVMSAISFRQLEL